MGYYQERRFIQILKIKEGKYVQFVLDHCTHTHHFICTGSGYSLPWWTNLYPARCRSNLRYYLAGTTSEI